MSCLFSSLLEDLYSPSDTALCIDIKIDGSVQDCSISIANAMEILQSCTKPSKYPYGTHQCVLTVAGQILWTWLPPSPAMDSTFLHYMVHEIYVKDTQIDHIDGLVQVRKT